jgi:hypothetical protein
VERAVKQRKTRALIITSVHRPDAEAVLKVLAKLLAKGTEAKTTAIPEQPSTDGGMPEAHPPTLLGLKPGIEEM